jgi:hypothetical protein
MSCNPLSIIRWYVILAERAMGLRRGCLLMRLRHCCQPEVSIEVVELEKIQSDDRFENIP